VNLDVVGEQLMPDIKAFLPKGSGDDMFRVTLEPWNGEGDKIVLKASAKVSDDENVLDLHVEIVEGE
jgi:hypothetical protein